ncbi:MAG: hypothetical protein WCH99_04215 [Verrucomicrobiota bacterium]
MKAALILAASLLLAGWFPASAAGLVELNGIVCLFGGKTALLVLSREAEAKPTSFMLSEGESQFGIKLLAVDVARQRVLIEQFGLKQYLRICSAPNLTISADGETGAEAGGFRLSGEKAVEEFLASEVVQRIKSGDYVWNGRASGGNQNTQAADNADNPAAASTATAQKDTAQKDTAQKDYTKEYWYQDCLATEECRIRYAKEVLAGEMTPLPRTPLTPPGTPGKLMDREIIYSNRIPGYRMVGYVD